MLGVMALIEAGLDLIPKLIALGEDVIPLARGIGKAFDDLGTEVSPDDEAFKALKAKRAEVESNFDADLQARLAEEES